jgi:uncharacterized protein YdaU (DUF1376 family)
MANKTDIWMPLYIGDYLADTAHLDAERHGCYLLWMMHYWRKGPLPDNIEDLVSIGKLRSSNAPSIAQALLREFFTKNGDGTWHQKRQDAERDKWQQKKLSAIEKASRAAKARWEDAPSNAPSMPQAMLERCPSPLPSPLPLSTPKPKKQSSPSAQVLTLYKAYPRHTAPEAAYVKIQKALNSRTFDELLLAVQAFKRKISREGTDPQYIPHPATWFNQGRYDDEEFKPDYEVKANGQIANGNGHGNGFLSKSERGQRAYEQVIAEILAEGDGSPEERSDLAGRGNGSGSVAGLFAAAGKGKS